MEESEAADGGVFGDGFPSAGTGLVLEEFDEAFAVGEVCDVAIGEAEADESGGLADFPIRQKPIDVLAPSGSVVNGIDVFGIDCEGDALEAKAIGGVDAEAGGTIGGKLNDLVSAFGDGGAEVDVFLIAGGGVEDAVVSAWGVDKGVFENRLQAGV